MAGIAITRTGSWCVVGLLAHAMALYLRQRGLWPYDLTLSRKPTTLFVLGVFLEVVRAVSILSYC